MATHPEARPVGFHVPIYGLAASTTEPIDWNTADGRLPPGWRVDPGDSSKLITPSQSSAVAINLGVTADTLTPTGYVRFGHPGSITELAAAFAPGAGDTVTACAFGNGNFGDNNGWEIGNESDAEVTVLLSIQWWP